MLRILFLIVSFVPFLATANEQNKFLLSKYSAEISLAENYLNNVRTLSANFEQTAENEKRSEGNFFISRPGKLKLEYLKPSELVILIKDKTLTYFDRELDEVTRSRVDSTVLKFLIKNRISFQEDILVTEIIRSKDQFKVTIADRGDLQDGGLEIIFDSQVKNLIGINTISPEGKITKIKFNQLKTNLTLAKDTFILNRNFLKRK